MPVDSNGRFFADFDNGVIPSDFTVDSVTTTTEGVDDFNGIGTGSNVFAGNFLRNVTNGPGNKTTLTLTNLPSHTSIDLNFLLGLIDTWDGSVGAGSGGPDFFNVTVDGTPILSETFANFGFNPQSYATQQPLAKTELFDTPGRSFSFASTDSAYDMGLDPRFDNIAHTADTLTIEWFADGDGWEGDPINFNESWAIDNVEVQLNGLNTNTDTTAPQLNSTNALSPADNSTNVPSNSNLVITFDEDVQAGTGNLIIRDANDNAVEIIAITPSLINGNTVTIDPSVDLDPSTNYYVEIDPTAIQDLAGNNFAGITGNNFWNFTTGAPDTTAPGLNITDPFSPADDSTNVPSNTNLVITFDEPVQAGTGNFIIRDANGNPIETIAITPSLINGNTVTIDPSVDLDPSTDYYIEIESGAIQDLAGNPYAGFNDPNTWNFTTSSTSNQGLPELQVDDNGVFSIVGSGTTNLKAQFVSNNADFVNELGVFTVNDTQGTIIDPQTNQALTPADGDAYIQAALKQSKVLFSSIADNPNGFDPAELSRKVELNGGDNLVFYLVSNSTSDAVISGQTPSSQVILGAAFDSDAFNPVQVTEANGQFNLSWEDQVGGGDQSFEDLVISLQVTNDPIAKGTQLQGGNPAELIDLTAESGLVDFNYSVHREANFNNEVYFYQIDNADGLIGSLDPNNASQADYLQAVLNNLVQDAVTGETIKFTADDNNTQTGSASIQAGSILAPMMIVNGTLEQLTDGDTSNDPQVYFPHVGANSDGFDSINLLADNTFGFEDMGPNGDRDYNDLIVKIDFA